MQNGDAAPAGPAPEGGREASVRITHERGPMTRQVRDAAVAWGGEVAWTRLLLAVSPACRARFQRPIGFFEWVESPLALELHEAWAAQRGQDDMAQRGEDAARQILGGAQRWLLRFASPAFVLENAPRMFAFYYRGGQLRLTRLEAGLAHLELHADGYPETWFREALRSWIQVALEMAGAREVRTAYEPPEDPASPLHRYEVAWSA